MFHSLSHGKAAQVERSDGPGTNEDAAAYEKRKVKGAIRTDFVLSAEIIAITLGTVAGATFSQQVIVLCGIAVVMTLGVYGIVAGIVRLDDLGLYLSRKSSALARSLGGGIVRAAPYLMKTPSIVGTVAMFMVGGGILTHGLPPVHHLSKTGPRTPRWCRRLAISCRGGSGSAERGVRAGGRRRGAGGGVGAGAVRARFKA